MSWFKQRSIYQKIFFMVLVLILLLGISLTFLVEVFMDDFVAQQLTKRGLEIASHVAKNSANYALVDDYYSLHELARQTKEGSEDVRYVVIVGGNHQLLAHTFGDGMPRSLLPGNSEPHPGTVKLTSNEGVIYDTIVPSGNGDQGYVRVGMTPAHMRNWIQIKIHHLLVVILLVCALAAALCFKLTRLITQPISRLVTVAENITRGKLNLRAPIDEGGEIGKLALTFNEMTTGLVSANREKERLLQKLITAQEDERKRISRELHDETSQALTSLMVSIRILAEEAGDEAQRSALLTVRDVTAEILRDIRNLAVELRPPVLDDIGLSAALEKYVEQFCRHYEIAVDLKIIGEFKPQNSQIAVAVYRIIQEGLTNIAKHSEASQVTIVLTTQNQAIHLMMEDNGIGISQEAREKARREKRLGLYGMAERAELLGGRLTVTAGPSRGTKLEATIPNNGGEHVEKNSRDAG